MASEGRRTTSIFYEKVPMTVTDWLVDCVIAAGAFGFAMLQMSISAQLFVPDDFMRRILGIQSVSLSTFAMMATLLTCIPLIFRRRFAWPAFMTSLALWIIFDWGFDLQSLSLASPLVALFTVAYERGRQEAFIAGGITLAITLLASLGNAADRLNALLIFQNVTFVVAVTLGGYALHVRQEYLQAAESRALEADQLRQSETKRAQEAERTRESEASRRVEEERVRIARELHDITAHSLSAVSIQAAAAERLIDTDPQAARTAIEEARTTAKSALADMRSMVGVLRSGEDAELEPTEGTDRMATLESYLEGAGIECDLFMYGYDRSSIPTHVDVALFGIAREACTNIVRHSGASKAVIALRELDDIVMMHVYDNGRGIDPSQEGKGGHGIEGMRERVKLLEGKLLIASPPDGGTRVRVVIPATWKEDDSGS